MSPKPLITGWTARNLPAKHSLIRTVRGALYEVDEPVVEDREHGDSAAGFVFAYQLNDNGTQASKRRTRIYAGDIAGKLDLS